MTSLINYLYCCCWHWWWWWCCCYLGAMMTSRLPIISACTDGEASLDGLLRCIGNQIAAIVGEGLSLSLSHPLSFPSGPLFWFMSILFSVVALSMSKWNLMSLLVGSIRFGFQIGWGVLPGWLASPHRCSSWLISADLCGVNIWELYWSVVWGIASGHVGFSTGFMWDYELYFECGYVQKYMCIVGATTISSTGTSSGAFINKGHFSWIVLFSTIGDHILYCLSLLFITFNEVVITLLVFFKKGVLTYAFK
jgi:hypothetical protein